MYLHNQKMQVFLQGTQAAYQQTKQRTWEMGVNVSLDKDTRAQLFFLKYLRIFNISIEEAKPQQTQCGSLKKNVLRKLIQDLHIK